MNNEFIENKNVNFNNYQTKTYTLEEIISAVKLQFPKISLGEIYQLLENLNSEEKY